jgi:hypothetical protein
MIDKSLDGKRVMEKIPHNNPQIQKKAYSMRR